MDGEGDDGIWTPPLPSDSKTFKTIKAQRTNFENETQVDRKLNRGIRGMVGACTSK